MEVEGKLIEFNDMREEQEQEITTLKKQLKLAQTKLKRCETKLNMRLESSSNLVSPVRPNDDIKEAQKEDTSSLENELGDSQD